MELSQLIGNQKTAMIAYPLNVRPECIAECLRESLVQLNLPIYYIGANVLIPPKSQLQYRTYEAPVPPEQSIIIFDSAQHALHLLDETLVSLSESKILIFLTTFGMTQETLNRFGQIFPSIKLLFAAFASTGDDLRFGLEMSREDTKIRNLFAFLMLHRDQRHIILTQNNDFGYLLQKDGHRVLTINRSTPFEESERTILQFNEEPHSGAILISERLLGEELPVHVDYLHFLDEVESSDEAVEAIHEMYQRSSVGRERPAQMEIRFHVNLENQDEVKKYRRVSKELNQIIKLSDQIPYLHPIVIGESSLVVIN